MTPGPTFTVETPDIYFFIFTSNTNVMYNNVTCIIYKHYCIILYYVGTINTLHRRMTVLLRDREAREGITATGDIHSQTRSRLANYGLGIRLGLPV